MAAGKFSAVRAIAYWLCAVALAAVFIYAGSVKLLDPAGFFADIKNYRIVPEVVAWWLAIALPPLEIILGVAVLVRPLAAVASAALFQLCLLFLLAIISAWLRGLDITCGCFGSSTTAEVQAPYATMIIRDLVFMALAIVVMAECWRTRCQHTKCANRSK